MKKKLLVIAGAILAILLICFLLVPRIILLGVTQEKVAEDCNYGDVFFNEYEEVRAHFLEKVEEFKVDGVKVQSESYEIAAEEDLYIDSLYVPAKSEQTNLIVLTTGVHGIEGYIGSVMLDVFWEEVYPTLNAENTGVLIVANVNPYGMKYHRRYNENNVDLNRNFIMDWQSHNLATNQNYPKVVEFFEPQEAMGNLFLHELKFYGGMIKTVLKNDVATITNALTGGQYEYAEGVYYGGAEDQESTVYLKNVFEQTLTGSYENIVHIDVHSGYGPRYNMVIFNSIYDTYTEAESQELFNYDYIIAYDSESFYPTTGDTTDFYYRLWEKLGKQNNLFSTCFEFGTLGDGLLDSIMSMKYTVEENQNHWFPSDNKVTNEAIWERYHEMFYPTEKEWREKTIEDFKAACKGVLDAKLVK